QAKSLGAFLTVVGLAFSALLIRLFPIQPDDAEWSSMWLVTAVVDYYVAASCFCAVAVATEGPRMGTVWSLLTLILGAPFACAYTALHIYRTGSLRFRDFWYAAVDTPPSQEKRLPASTSTLLVVFYAVVGIAFASRLGWTLFTYPLLPLQTEVLCGSAKIHVSSAGDYNAPKCISWKGLNGFANFHTILKMTGHPVTQLCNN
ncbi:unnamed protein product, partial [Symbiodinium sp. CCMP2456]